MSTPTTGPMPEAFGGYLHFMRVQVRHMSQREFCERTGVDPHTLNAVERGEQAPWDVATLKRVAAVLNVEVTDRTYTCFICGKDITTHAVYHETGSGRCICVDHLDDPAHYWTAGAKEGP